MWTFVHTMPPPNPQQPQEQPQQQPQPDIQQGVRANQFGPTVKSFGPGFLFSCQYQFFKHDPAPLVLMTRVYLDGRIAGINLHYLTFPYVKWLIGHYCGKADFSYQAIKGDKFVVNAFRTYKRAGLRLVKQVDCEFLITLLAQMRSWHPKELEAMRKEVQRQLRERLNPKASDLARQYSRGVVPGQDNFGLQRPTQSPLDNPSLQPPIRGTGTIPGQPASIPGQQA